MQKRIYEKHRAPGRPQVYARPILIRLAPNALKAIDKWARQHKTQRNEAIRRLLEIGLRAKEKRVKTEE